MAHFLNSRSVHFDGLPTFRLLAPRIVPAANKYHIVLHNNTGAAQSLFLMGLYAINDNVAAVVGVINQFRAYFTTGAPTLTALTPTPFNSADPALANVTAGHTATAGLVDGAELLPMALSSEEQTAVPANTSMFLQHTNLLPQLHSYSRPLTLRPGQGFAVKQIGAGTVGNLSWILDFSVAAD